MRHDYECEEGRIMLKPLEKVDIEALRILRSKVRNCFLNTQVTSSENQEHWYESYLKKEGDYMFKIVKRDKPTEFIGAIAIYDVDNYSGCAEFGRLVVDKEIAPEKGLGYEAVKAICKFSFDVLQLSQIRAFVLIDNERAMKTYLKVGFRIKKKTEQGFYVEMVKEQLV